MEEKMKTFIFAILLSSSSAYAANSTTALKLICMPMNAKPEFYACLQTFVRYSYYEESALKICATMSDNSDKILCMDSVGDATYDKEETDLCATKILDSEKQECLDAHGRTYP
jgi:hypothetical protein